MAHIGLFWQLQYLYTAFLAISCPTALALTTSCLDFVQDDYIQHCNCEIDENANNVVTAINCQDRGFTETHLSNLLGVSKTLENLTFVGNNISELPTNIFGMGNNMDKLKYIDLSRNNIHTIHGQTFHGVRNVETLILDSNHWFLDNHTRALSNFYSLRNLSLNHAIEKHYNQTIEHITRLSWILKESDLKLLEEFHIQYNDIMFVDRDIFCGLTSLKRVHLANNVLFDGTGLFNTRCMNNVEEFYLHNNSLSYFHKDEIEELNKLVNQHTLKVLTLYDNPWACACAAKDFIEWLQGSTSNIVKERHELKCSYDTKNPLYGTPLMEVDVSKINCAVPPNNMEKRLKAPYVIIGLLFAAIFVFVGALLWCKRDDIRSRVRKVSVPIITRWSANRGPDYQGLV